MKRIIPLLILSLLVFSTYSQKKVEEISVKAVIGVAIGADNESVAQVTQRAINEAKAASLKQAGIEENIASFTDYFQKEENGQYEDLFTSDFLSDIRGSVKNVEIIDTKKSFDDVGHLKVKVVINCTVVKYLTEKDIGF